jgi:Sec-independent protein translocase protein TatA
VETLPSPFTIWHVLIVVVIGAMLFGRPFGPGR